MPQNKSFLEIKKTLRVVHAVEVASDEKGKKISIGRFPSQPRSMSEALACVVKSRRFHVIGVYIIIISIFLIYPQRKVRPPRPPETNISDTCADTTSTDRQSFPSYFGNIRKIRLVYSPQKKKT